MLSARTTSGARLATKGARQATVVRAQQGPKTWTQKTRLDDVGFVNNDNSGKGNVFPTTSKAFYSSPTTEAAAQQGLGGATGGAVLAAALGVVGLATAAVLGVGSGETLNQVQAADIESLSTIASRIAASL